MNRLILAYFLMLFAFTGHVMAQDNEGVKPSDDDKGQTEKQEALKKEVVAPTFKKNDYKPFDGIDLKTLNTDLPSLLYQGGKIDRFYDQLISYKLSGGILPNSLAVYEEKKEEKKEKPDIKTLAEKSVEVDKTAPSFFLSSILYESNNNWTAWLDGKKVRFEDKKASDKLEIVEVKPDSVTFLWTPKDIGFYSPGYTSVLKAMAPIKGVDDRFEWNLKSEKQEIYVDGIREAVQFTLKPNQTFVSFYMKIVEGKVDDIPIVEGDKPSIPSNNTNIKNKLKKLKESQPEAQLEGLDL